MFRDCTEENGWRRGSSSIRRLNSQVLLFRGKIKRKKPVLGANAPSNTDHTDKHKYVLASDSRSIDRALKRCIPYQSETIFRWVSTSGSIENTRYRRMGLCGAQETFVMDQKLFHRRRLLNRTCRVCRHWLQYAESKMHCVPPGEISSWTHSVKQSLAAIHEDYYVHRLRVSWTKRVPLFMTWKCYFPLRFVDSRRSTKFS